MARRVTWAAEKAEPLLPVVVHPLRQHETVEVVEPQLLVLEVQEPRPRLVLRLLLRQVCLSKWRRPRRALLVYPVERVQPVDPVWPLQERVAVRVPASVGVLPDRKFL